MGVFDHIIEQRIREAAARGELDNLPGQGKPLPGAPDDLVPVELRMAYKILRNAGYLPPELDLRREIDDARAELESASDDAGRDKMRGRLQGLLLRLNAGEDRHFNLVLQEQYYRRVLDKLSRPGSDQEPPGTFGK